MCRTHQAHVGAESCRAYRGGVRAGDDVPCGEYEREDCSVGAAYAEARNGCGTHAEAELGAGRRGGGRREEIAKGLDGLRGVFGAF